MDENTQVVIESSVFEDAWNEDAFESEADSGDSSHEEPEVTEENSEDTPEEQEETSEPPAEQQDVFTIRHLHEDKQYSREQVIDLAQKGLNYDRLRAERDEMKPQLSKLKDYESFLGEIAADSGVSVEQLMEDIRTTRLVERERAAGKVISDTAAREQIQREKNTRAEAPAEEPAEEKKQPDFEAFCRAYPDVKATDIPDSVWNEVRGGADLTLAYSRHEKAQLKTQIETLKTQVETLKTNEKNRKLSTGSMQSRGGTNEKNNFDRAWEDSDY